VTDDVNGMLKKTNSTPADAVRTTHEPTLDEDPDDASFVPDDDDDDLWDGDDDPVVIETVTPEQPPPLRKGQVWKNGRLYGAGTGRPLPFVPRPLPALPALPQLVIPATVRGGATTPIPWTNLYKYLGFMLRADLLDDHAYARVELKTEAAAERLFPHHRLVRAWPIGLQLQLFQAIVLSITAHVMPLLTSMRCESESKTKRLDQLRKKIARSILRLSGSSRHAYIVSEACLGDVLGDVTLHRARLLHALSNHPLRDMPAPHLPVEC